MSHVRALFKSLPLKDKKLTPGKLRLILSSGGAKADNADWIMYSDDEQVLISVSQNIGKRLKMTSNGKEIRPRVWVPQKGEKTSLPSYMTGDECLLFINSNQAKNLCQALELNFDEIKKEIVNQEAILPDDGYRPDMKTIEVDFEDIQKKELTEKPKIQAGQTPGQQTSSQLKKPAEYKTKPTVEEQEMQVFKHNTMSGMNSHGGFVPILLDFNKLNNKQQAKEILDRARYYHEILKFKKAGIIYSANHPQTLTINACYKSGRWFTNTDGGGQAAVIFEIEKLLKTDEYEDLRDIFRIIPITTCKESGPKGMTTPEWIDQDIEHMNNFVIKEENLLMGWQNQGTKNSYAVARDKIVGKAGEKGICITPELKDKVIGSLNNLNENYSLPPLPPGVPTYEEWKMANTKTQKASKNTNKPAKSTNHFLSSEFNKLAKPLTSPPPPPPPPLNFSTKKEKVDTATLSTPQPASDEEIKKLQQLVDTLNNLNTTLNNLLVSLDKIQKVLAPAPTLGSTVKQPPEERTASFKIM